MQLISDFDNFFLNQEDKNCTTQNHSPTDLVVTDPTALTLHRTGPQLPGRTPPLFALHTAMAHQSATLTSSRSCCTMHPLTHSTARTAQPLLLVTTVALHFVPSQTSTPIERRCRPCETLALERCCRLCKT